MPSIQCSASCSVSPARSVCTALVRGHPLSRSEYQRHTDLTARAHENSSVSATRRKRVSHTTRAALCRRAAYDLLDPSSARPRDGLEARQSCSERKRRGAVEEKGRGRWRRRRRRWARRSRKPGWQRTQATQTQLRSWTPKTSPLAAEGEERWHHSVQRRSLQVPLLIERRCSVVEKGVGFATLTCRQGRRTRSAEQQKKKEQRGEQLC